MNFHLPAPLSFPRFLIYSPKSPKSLFSFFLLNCFFSPSPLFSPQPLFRSSCRLLQWTPSSPSSPKPENSISLILLIFPSFSL
ncbi:hypothetical protein I3760_01G135200 [Carya illinoinensis]|nr:hypothetical protein I3760_01G135200 [Carya illinoinensis]